MTRWLFGSLLILALPLPCLSQPPASIEWVGEFTRQGDPGFQPGHTEVTTPWLALRELNGVAYLAFEQPPRVERYEIETREWMSPIDLVEPPTAFGVDTDGLYISFGRRTSRFDLNGSGETHLRNTNYAVTDLVTHGDFIYLNAGRDLLSVDKWVGTLMDWQTYSYRMRGISIAGGLGQIYGRTNGVSPADIVQVFLFPDGTLGSQVDSPYHGDYPGATRTFVFPHESFVADDSGIVYQTPDLTYANSLAGSFQDMSFYGVLPIVLRDGSLFSYSESFLRTGQYTPQEGPLAIVVVGEEIIAFSYPEGSVHVEHIPIGYLTPQEPGSPIDPSGLEYVPDQVVLGSDDLVYVLSRGNRSVFRWSLEERRYLETIPLALAPKYMAYSSIDHSLYFAYTSGEITSISLSGSKEFVELPFVNSPQTPCGLATAGEFVFVCDPSGAWVSHFTYGSDGALISQEEWNYFSHEYVWNAANRRMYHFRDGTSPNDLLWEEIDEQGVIGDQFDSPYHSSEGIQHPIRVAADGSLVLLGSGRLYDALTLVQVDTLANDIEDAAWVEGHPISIRSFGSWSQLQKWDQPNWGVGAVRELQGTPLRLFGWRDELVAITLRAGKPWISRWTQDLEGVEPSVLKDDGLRFVDAGAWLEYSIVVSNPAPEPFADMEVRDAFPDELVDIIWSCAASLGSSCGSGIGDIDDTAFLAPQGTLVYLAVARVPIQTTSLLINQVRVAVGGDVFTDTDLTQVTAAPGLVFVDDFESGDTSAWSEVGGSP